MDGKAGIAGKMTHSVRDMLGGPKKLFYVLKILDLKLSPESIFVVVAKDENTKDRIYGSSRRTASNFIKINDSL